MPLLISVMPAVRRISFALKSLRVLAEVLNTVPDSREKTDLFNGVRVCSDAVQRWHQQPPTVEENELVMSHIFKLHLAVARLRTG